MEIVKEHVELINAKEEMSHMSKQTVAQQKAAAVQNVSVNASLICSGTDIRYYYRLYWPTKTIEKPGGYWMHA
jgi:hypothetical protein